MYHVDIINNGNSSFQVKSKDYELVVDTKGKGITPPDTLLAGLGACIGVYIRKYAEGAKLNIEQFSLSVDAEFSKEPPVCFKEIRVSVDLKGFQLEERREKAFLEFVKNCPMHSTLKENPLVEIKIL
ncbi:MAG: OsmC family protein [Candidatus Omnitrophica bacterium]|nr:OsmC family protein [Candidatus Omnitrophota bacterium]